MWEEIALSLLKKYTERYYTFRKREWELPHLEYQELAADDPNFLGVKEEPGNGYYRILIESRRRRLLPSSKTSRPSLRRATSSRGRSAA